jgi:pimeloyl-ACP methyl ester carboxylesterase
MASWRRIVIALFVLVLALVLLGTIFDQLGQQRDRARFSQVGRSLDVGGRTLNLSCAGDHSPTVVFETSSHQAGYSWIAIQRDVATFARACWYDRAGYGWSEPSPRPHTSASIAADLHRLLQAAAITPPYVLVGEDQAALHIRVFNSLYPKDVAGVVFVDGADIEVLDEPEFTKGPWARHFGSWAPYVRRASCTTAMPLASAVGIGRLLSPGVGVRPTPAFGLTPAQQTEVDALSDNPTANESGELCDLEESRAQVRAAGTLGDRPLIVLASARRMPFTPPDLEEARTVDAFNSAWLGRLQPRLAALSTRGRLVTVADNRPPAHVTQAIRDVLAQIR